MVSPLPLRVPKTAELLARRLRMQIIRGELVQGSSLPGETELMATFGVSRHVLREAFRILESEHLITVRRGAQGGALVLAPDPQVAAGHVAILLQVLGTTTHDVQRSRLAIEPEAVRWLSELDPAARSSAADALRELNEKLAAVIDDPAAFATSTLHFHVALVRLAGNKTLGVMMGLLSEIIASHITFQQRAAYPDLLERRVLNARSTRANERLITLVLAGDPEAAAAYWREHLTAVMTYLNEPGPLVDLLG